MSSRQRAAGTPTVRAAQLALSVQAAHTGAVVVLSQDRSAKRDRMIADLDFTNNEKGEQLVEPLLSEGPTGLPG